MAKERFKVGDCVRKKPNTGNCCSALEDTIYTVEQDGGNGLGIGSDRGSLCHCESEWELVNNNVKNMTLKEKFAVAFKGEPEKSFIKAGVMNVDESLTSEGQALFSAYLLKKFGADFKTDVIDTILAEDEKQKA